MKYLIRHVTVFDGEKMIGQKNVFIEDSKVKNITDSVTNTPYGMDEKEIDSQHKDILIIEGEKLILSPGFIDIHTHSDIDIVQTRSQNFISQGVTTVVGGNCGISCGKINNPKLEGVVNPQNFEIPNFVNIAEYWEWLKTQKMAVNYASLLGHHTLVEESNYDMEQLIKNLAKYLELGFLGVSIGLVYGWGESIKSSLDLLPIAKCLSDYNAILTSHVRDQASGLYDSVKMFTDLWENRDCQNLRIQISHLKHMIATDPNKEETLKKTLHLLDGYHAQNPIQKPIGVDVYPYTAGATSLALKNRHLQCINGWDDVFPFGYNKSVGEIAREKGQTPEKVTEDIINANPKILAIYMNSCRESDIWEIISKPYAMIASDGLPTHPRHWGTYTRVLKHVREENLNLESYLTKMTSIPARQFVLRGLYSCQNGIFVLIFPAPELGKISTLVDGNISNISSRLCEHINQNMDSSHSPLGIPRYSPQVVESVKVHYLQNYKDD